MHRDEAHHPTEIQIGELVRRAAARHAEQQLKRIVWPSLSAKTAAADGSRLIEPWQGA